MSGGDAAGGADAGGWSSSWLLDLGSEPVRFLGWEPLRGSGAWLVASASHAWEISQHGSMLAATPCDPGFSARPDDGGAVEILGITSSTATSLAMMRNGTGFRLFDLWHQSVVAEGTLDDGPLYFESGANVVLMQRHLVFRAGTPPAWAVHELPAEPGAPQITFGRDTADNHRQQAVVASSAAGLSFYDGTPDGTFPARTVAIPDSAGLVAQCGYFDGLAAIIVAGPSAEAAPTAMWSIEGVRTTALDVSGLTSACLGARFDDVNDLTILMRSGLRLRTADGTTSWHDYGGFAAEAGFCGIGRRNGVEEALLSGTLDGRRGLAFFGY